jgi:hypothetical protein
VYREGFEALRTAVLHRRDEAAAREADLRGLRRVVLPDEDREALRLHRERMWRDIETLEDVTQLDAELDAYERALESASQEATRLLAFDERAPAFVRDDEGPQDPRGDVRAMLGEALGRYGETIACAGRAFVATIDTGKLQLLVRAQTTVVCGDEWDALRTVMMTLSAHAPKALPSLVVRPELVADRLKKLLRLDSEVEVGDAWFDGRFWIRGGDELARAILCPEVVDSLSGMARWRPSLTIDFGLVELTWTLGPEDMFVELKDILPSMAIGIHETLRDRLLRAQPSLRGRDHCGHG